MKTRTEELRMRIAKLNYQHACLIGDKDIDRLWYELLNREWWFDSADQILQACKEYLVFRDGSEIDIEIQQADP